jgi:hypothetical protein
VPKPILVLAKIGFCVSCVLMFMLAQKVYAKLKPPEQAAAAFMDQMDTSNHIVVASLD